MQSGSTLLLAVAPFLLIGCHLAAAETAEEICVICMLFDTTTTDPPTEPPTPPPTEPPSPPPTEPPTPPPTEPPTPPPTEPPTSHSPQPSAQPTQPRKPPQPAKQKQSPPSEKETESSGGADWSTVVPAVLGCAAAGAGIFALGKVLHRRSKQQSRVGSLDSIPESLDDAQTPQNNPDVPPMGGPAWPDLEMPNSRPPASTGYALPR